MTADNHKQAGSSIVRFSIQLLSIPSWCISVPHPANAGPLLDPSLPMQHLLLAYAAPPNPPPMQHPSSPMQPPSTPMVPAPLLAHAAPLYPAPPPQGSIPLPHAACSYLPLFSVFPYCLSVTHIPDMTTGQSVGVPMQCRHPSSAAANTWLSRFHCALQQESLHWACGICDLVVSLYCTEAWNVRQRWSTVSSEVHWCQMLQCIVLICWCIGSMLSGCAHTGS